MCFIFYYYKPPSTEKSNWANTLPLWSSPSILVRCHTYRVTRYNIWSYFAGAFGFCGGWDENRSWPGGWCQWRWTINEVIWVPPQHGIMWHYGIIKPYVCMCVWFWVWVCVFCSFRRLISPIQPYTSSSNCLCQTRCQRETTQHFIRKAQVCQSARNRSPQPKTIQNVLFSLLHWNVLASKGFEENVGVALKTCSRVFVLGNAFQRGQHFRVNAIAVLAVISLSWIAVKNTLWF